MKGTLILCLFALSLFLVNAQYNVRPTRVLTPRVASDGFLILDTSGLNFPLRMKNLPQQDQFQLTITNQASNTNTRLSCFIYQFEVLSRSSSKIGCRTRGLTPGKYSLAPLVQTLPFVAVGRQLRLLPFNIAGSFEVTNAKEVYFYEYDDNDEDFDYNADTEEIDFDLFEPTSQLQEVYFGNVLVSCRPINYELKCTLSPKILGQNTRRRSYTIYIKDSNGIRKRNYFVLPVNIVLKY